MRRARPHTRHTGTPTSCWLLGDTPLAQLRECRLPMEWSSLSLTEELCVAVLRHLEPRHLASFSACCSAARRLAASDTLWRPLYDALEPPAHLCGGASATGAGGVSLAPVGVFREKCRKLRAHRLREQVWSGRQKVATIDGAHTEALLQCEELERAVHRTRVTVTSEQRAKRQRLADTSWHPAAVQRQLSGGIANTPLSARPAAATMNVASDGSSRAEQQLRQLEARSDALRALCPALPHPRFILPHFGSYAAAVAYTEHALKVLCEAHCCS